MRRTTRWAAPTHTPANAFPLEIPEEDPRIARAAPQPLLEIRNEALVHTRTRRSGTAILSFQVKGGVRAAARRSSMPSAGRLEARGGPPSNDIMAAGSYAPRQNPDIG
jgi:hypothetical protein